MRNKLNILWPMLLLLVPLMAFGQDLIIPSLWPDGRLDDVIAADTAGAGNADWVAGTRVYVLQRNGIYPIDGLIAVGAERTIHIRCEYGTTGYKPEIWAYDVPGTTGRPPANLITIGSKSQLILTNVNVSGYQEDTWSENEGMQTALFNVPSGNYQSRFVIDSCILKSTYGNHLRSDIDQMRIFVTNCIFADMGNCRTSYLVLGKGIDIRGRQIDTLYVCNNTFVNSQNLIIRHYWSTGAIDNLWFNNNTIVNGMSYNGMLALGIVGTGALEIKNNLLIDANTLGDDTAYIRQLFYSPMENSGERDAFGQPRVLWVIAIPNPSANWDIENNYYTVSDSGAYMYNALPDPFHYPQGLGPIYTQSEGSPLSYQMNAQLALLGRDTLNTFKKIAVQPVNIPQLMTNFIRWLFITRAAPDSGGGKGAAGNLDPFWLRGYQAPGVYAFDYNRKTMRYYVDTFNCNFYSNAALSGIGDPRWSQIGPLTTGTSMSMAQNWNLVSVPRIQLDNSGSAIFPGMQGSAYAYNTTTAGYDAAPILENGAGYWVNYGSPTSVTNIGSATSAPLTITVANAGWVLIGSRAWQIRVDELMLSDGGTIAGSAYRYNTSTGSYDATTVINPGEAVWINVMFPVGECTITLP